MRKKPADDTKLPYSEAQMAFFHAIAVYRALITAQGEPGDAFRLSLTAELFSALEKTSSLINKSTPNVSRSLDELSLEFLKEAMNRHNAQTKGN